VQIDFTEGRLALKLAKLDPSGGLLDQFINLNNRVLARFSDNDGLPSGVRSCPGGDHDGFPDHSVLMGDINFGVFSVAWAASRRGHDVLLRLQPARAAVGPKE
jgi:5-methyltetrahydropteroyltriglutamate--homocysteine methyltransferase